MRITEKDDIIYIRNRKFKHWIAVLIFLSAVLLAIKINITDINVKGTRTYTDEEAISLVFTDRWDRNTLYCMIKELLGKKKEIPFISDYKIDITGPSSCDLIMYEKNPVGCIKYMSNFMYFDNDGIIIESSQQRLEGIPIIEGVMFGHIVLGGELPVENKVLFDDIMNVTQQCELYEIGCDRIMFDDLGQITISLDGGDIDVELGTNDDLAAKISVLRDMLPDLRNRGLKGTLDLKDYQDKGKNMSTSFRVKDEKTNIG